MKKTKVALLITLVLIYFVANPVLAQQEMSPEQFYINQAVSEKFASMRKAAKSSFNGVLLYPEDIRNALLELSQYPDLITLLANKKYLTQEELDKFLKAQPQEAKDAVEKLKDYPEIIDILSQHIAVSTILGEVYKDKKETTSQVISRLSKSVEVEQKESVDAWTQQLQQDPERVKQLQDAAEAYAKANNLPSPNQPVPAAQAGKTDNPYGYYVNEKSEVVIYNMPSPQMMQYLLMNQTLYMMLFSAAVSHHHHYHDDYYWDYYDEHWEDDWNEYEDSVDKVGDELEDLNKNIDEIQDNREDAKDKWEDRKEDRPETLPEDAKDKWQDRQENRPENLPANLQEKRESGDWNKQMLNQPSSGFPGNRSNVTSQLPSRQQQIGRASQFHSGSWGQRSGGATFGSRGGGSSSSFGGGSRSSASRSGGASGGGSRSFSGGGGRRR